MPDASSKIAPTGCLYLVATPIGNLEDITLRALRVLKEADAIACEDTRHTLKLLNHYGIRKRLVSYHEHNESKRAVELVDEMISGARIALVSDAGMPVVSDPGLLVIRLCVASNITVIPVPGPSALIAALAASGLPVEEFLFAGFLPARSGERRRALQKYSAMPQTLIFYEAPHRIAAMLEDALAILGNRSAVIAREITKAHEEFLRGPIADLLADLRRRPRRGEMTVLIGPPEANQSAPAPKTSKGLAERVLEIQRDMGLDNKAAIKQAAHEFGIRRREGYQRWLRERGGETDSGNSG